MNLSSVLFRPKITKTKGHTSTEHVKKVSDEEKYYQRLKKEKNTLAH